MTSLRGTGVSPGVAVGQALVVEHEAGPVFRLSLTPDECSAEVARLEQALAASAAQIEAIKARLSREVGAPHAYIFDAHLLMLRDPLLRERAIEVVRQESVNAEWALRTVSESLHALFSDFSDAYLRERSTDLDDVIGRIQLNLRGSPGAPSLARLPEPVVLVAGDLRPSEAAELDWDKVLAIVTDVGSSTYHTAIIARSLGIPAVAGLKEATRLIPPGALVAVDGARGEVVVEPSPEALVALRAAQERHRREDERLRGTRALVACTPDGVAVRLEANVEFPEEAATAQLYGAQGIGLFRSEYLLGRGLRFPTEEQQLDVYRRLLEQMHPFPVTVRTWDVGGEVLGPVGPSSPNPALGERALRLLRRSAEPFRVQLRALLRAGTHGPIRVMFPFVSGVSDLRVALALVEQVKRGAARRGHRLPRRRAGRDQHRGPERGGGRRPPGGRGRLLQRGHERPDPVPAGGGPYRPARVGALRAAAPGRAAHARGHRARGCLPRSSRSRSAARWPASHCRPSCSSASATASSRWRPSAIPRVKEALRAVPATEARALAARALELSSGAEIEALVREALPALAQVAG